VLGGEGDSVNTTKIEQLYTPSSYEERGIPKRAKQKTLPVVLTTQEVCCLAVCPTKYFDYKI
jgi:hypothetical protein